MSDRAWYVYIVASRSLTLYIGITGDIYQRAAQHKKGEIEGFTRKYKCNRLVYYECFDSPVEAIAREKQLKGWRRSKKIALIQSKNPSWSDLAEDWGKTINLGTLFRQKG